MNVLSETSNNTAIRYSICAFDRASSIGFEDRIRGIKENRARVAAFHPSMLNSDSMSVYWVCAN